MVEIEDRQYNGRNKKDKETYIDLQNIIQKTKSWATQIPQKPGMNSGASEG